MSQIEDLFSESLEVFQNYESLYQKLNLGIKNSKKMNDEQRDKLFTLVNTGYNELNKHLATIEKNKGQSYDIAKNLYPSRNPAAWGRESQYNQLISSMKTYKKQIEQNISKINSSSDAIINDLESFVSKF